MSITLSELTPLTVHLSGNDMWVKATSSAIPVGATDYRILLKVVSIDNVLIGTPFIDSIAPDTNRVAWFNIKGYIDQGISNEITWPIKTLYEGKVMSWVDKAYDIWLYGGESYTDSNGDYQETFEEDALQPFFIVPGRLPEHLQAKMKVKGTTWFEEYCEGGKFFSVMPDPQQITPYQPLKMWWIPPETFSDILVQIGWTIGGIMGATTLFLGTLYADILWEFECHLGGAAVPLTDIDGNRLEKVEIWVEQNAAAITERRVFNINWEPPVNNYWYLFADNQIGGIECIGLTGRAQLKVNASRTFVSTPLPRELTLLDATRKPVARTLRRRWTINTGVKPKAELEALSFLFDTPTAWLAVPPATGSTLIANYSIYPVNILNTEAVLNNDINDIESIDIEIEEAY